MLLPWACWFACLPLASSALSFDAYLEMYGKSYGTEEYAQRKAIFVRRVAEVDELNARVARLWTAGINQFTDFTDGEWLEQQGYNKAMRDASLGNGGPVGGVNDVQTQLPEAFDWRDHRPSVVSPVKNQGSCGSCWAFSATASIESHIAISTGKLVSLSPQQINSCTANPHHCGGDGGCMGAIPQLAFNYTALVGLSEIWDYPYVSGRTRQTEACFNLTGWTAAKITGYVQLPTNNAGALLEALFTVGPVSISVDASRWGMYRSGIFDACNKTRPDINHAVQLVGYGSESGVPYWSVRNSWGVLFGEDGYIRLRRYRGVGQTNKAGEEEPCGEDVTPEDGYSCEGGPSSMTVCGECGMLSDSSYPVGGRFGYKDFGSSGSSDASAVQVQKFSM